MNDETNQYKPAECVEVAQAQNMILGDKPRLPPDSIVGDPDAWHSPINFAEYEN